MKRASTLILLAAGATVVVAGRDWLQLAANAISYPTTSRGEAANLVVRDSVAFVTLAEAGVGIVNAATGRRTAVIAPPAGSGSADDLALRDNLLFVLDARSPGALSVYDVSNPLAPRLVSPPRRVPVEPFAGVSAGDGVVIVSGGTSRITVLAFDAAGRLADTVATADLGRGQPDVLAASTRPLAYVSTHYAGPSFGLDVVRLPSLSVAAELHLDNAGFTAGGSHPANFPIEMAELSPETLLVAHRGGLLVIGTADPARPVIMALVDLGAPAVNVDALDGVAAVSLAGRGPAVALVQFTPGPTVANHFDLPAGTLPAGVALTRDRVLVAAGARGVLAFDRAHLINGRM